MKKFLTNILEKLVEKLKTKESTAVSAEVLEVKRNIEIDSLYKSPDGKIELKKFSQSNIKNKKEKITRKEKFGNLTLLGKTPQEETPRLEKESIITLVSPQATSPQGIARDLMNLMDSPFLSLSKNRKKPIIYESPDGTHKTRISAHSECFIASIYDWDIILFVAGKLQEILNTGSDIPPRTLTTPRHEILKALHKHNVNTQQKELEKSLHRLKRTAIDTTICNEDGRYKADFGFIDSWEYTERKDIKEIKITLSQWLYNLICTRGSLLKVNDAYFDITSGLKKFLYRTARKHVGNNGDKWEFSVEKLYEKSGSEREFKKFKSDLKASVTANDIPEYITQWIVKNNRAFVVFQKAKTQNMDNFIETMSEPETSLNLI